MTMPEWFPVLTLLVGYGTKSLTDWIQHRRTVMREREARDATRRDQLYERQTTFQRDTLLALQEALFELGRAAGKVSHLDQMAIRATGSTQVLPADLDEGYRLAMVRTNLLAARVRDASVRELVEQFRQYCFECTEAPSEQRRNYTMRAAIEIQIQLNERIGTLLRTLDDADAA